MDEMSEGKREYLTLEEIHAELLKLLLRFDAFCKEHGLRYSLDSGTLLVRYATRGLSRGTTISMLTCRGPITTG